jgi:hypothetical protein
MHTPTDLARRLREAGINDRLINLVVLAKEDGVVLAATKLGITQAGVIFRVARLAEHIRKEGLVELADFLGGVAPTSR